MELNVTDELILSIINGSYVYYGVKTINILPVTILDIRTITKVEYEAIHDSVAKLFLCDLIKYDGFNLNRIS